ncbi:MAG: hypothetical protein AABX07_05580 [Nanoarchaeota archaeon]
MKYNIERNYQLFIEHLRSNHFPGGEAAGSVFDTKVFRGPKDVIEYAYNKVKYRYRGERMIFSVNCGRTIGLESLTSLDEIPAGTTIRKEIRGEKKGSKRSPGYTVWKAYGLKMRPTSKMVIILEPVPEKENLHRFSSIYPGRYAPDFDDKEFWSGHAFIVEKKS